MRGREILAREDWVNPSAGPAPSNIHILAGAETFDGSL